MLKNYSNTPSPGVHTMGIKIMIADDHEIVREGIRTVLQKQGGDIEISGEASNGRELLELSEKKTADIFIIDISMPLLNGIETTQRLLKKHPEAKVIMLSMYRDHSYVERALNSKAYGYVLKCSATDELASAIQEVARGRHYISPAISGYVVQGFLENVQTKHAGARSDTLSSREKEILQLIVEGHSTREIARHLDISVHTVMTHRKSMMSKTGARRQSDLIKYGLKEIISQA